jgi:hypothetical protein
MQPGVTATLWEGPAGSRHLESARAWASEACRGDASGSFALCSVRCEVLSLNAGLPSYFRALQAPKEAGTVHSARPQIQNPQRLLACGVSPAEGGARPHPCAALTPETGISTVPRTKAAALLLLAAPPSANHVPRNSFSGCCCSRSSTDRLAPLGNCETIN